MQRPSKNSFVLAPRLQRARARERGLLKKWYFPGIWRFFHKFHDFYESLYILRKFCISCEKVAPESLIFLSVFMLSQHVDPKSAFLQQNDAFSWKWPIFR